MNSTRGVYTRVGSFLGSFVRYRGGLVIYRSAATGRLASDSRNNVFVDDPQ